VYNVFLYTWDGKFQNYSISANAFLCVCICFWVCVLCVCVCFWACACVYVCVPVRISPCFCGYVHVCMSVSARVCVCLSVCLSYTFASKRERESDYHLCWTHKKVEENILVFSDSQRPFSAIHMIVNAFFRFHFMLIICLPFAEVRPNTF